MINLISGILGFAMVTGIPGCIAIALSFIFDTDEQVAIERDSA